VTVKGLEPDIQKLIAKHKAEVKKLKSTHQVTAFEWDRFSCDDLTGISVEAGNRRISPPTSKIIAAYFLY